MLMVEYTASVLNELKVSQLTDYFFTHFKPANADFCTVFDSAETYLKPNVGLLYVPTHRKYCNMV